MQDGRPIAFRSSELTPAERNYTTGEQELLAVFQALTCYVEGDVGLTLVTDRNPLTYLQTQQTLSRRQARWMEFMSQFSYTWQHRRGRINVVDPCHATLPSQTLRHLQVCPVYPPCWQPLATPTSG